MDTIPGDIVQVKLRAEDSEEKLERENKFRRSIGRFTLTTCIIINIIIIVNNIQTVVWMSKADLELDRKVVCFHPKVSNYKFI